MKWYKRYPDAFKGGTIGLSLEAIGAYSLIIDDLYDRNGNVPDDERYCCRLLHCDPRVWRRLREQLIKAGKIHTDGAMLSNYRATSELSSANLRGILPISRGRKHKKNNENRLVESRIKNLRSETPTELAARAAQFSFAQEPLHEHDMSSEDGSVIFRRAEIEQLARDFPAIKDIRAALRVAIRWAVVEVEPARRKTVIEQSLQNKNEDWAARQQQRAELHAIKLKKEADREARGERRRNGGGGPPIA